MQYQFLLNNLNESDRLEDSLIKQGIKASNIHFISENSADFAGHRVHEASIIEERDVVHKLERGAIVGLITGCLLSWLLYLNQPYGWQINGLNVVFILFLTIGFGGWIGGLIGISHRNYRLSDKDGELHQGKAMMLVYSDKQHESVIKNTIAVQFPDAQFVGIKSHFDNPLVGKKTVPLEM
ncbi:hypothetical protein [Neptunicella marina]|uniref:NAD/FAD-utilizing enzyme n=1 Tax=Neptunicella marina TaxID=2125989 RepID=A0A8J6LV13_9ALTE|nr:hypothetical protein [Neptunicella marina]MBC3764259.1 hypothetical protein [Neptunicella marina]